MKEWFKKYQCKCLGLLVAFIIVASPIFVNLLMNMTCSWASCKPNDWLGFWGSYLGAIGSFIMAIIAYYALLKNNEQLEYIKKQDRPYLHASIRKVIQQKETSYIDDKNPKRLYLTQTYYLSVRNYGNTIVREVNIDIQNCNSDICKDKRLSHVISEINNTHKIIPPKEELNFVIAVYSNNPYLTREQFNEQKLFFDVFEEPKFDIKIRYFWEFGKDEYEDSLYVKNTTTDATTIVQMLDYIDSSILKLNETVGMTRKNQE